MDEDDPEKRIAELERGLGNPGPVPPPPAGWQHPSQPPPAAWSAPSRPRNGILGRPVLLLAIAGIVILVACVGIAWAVTSSVGPKGPTQLHTADGLTGLLGTIRNKFGDTMGYELVVYPDYADLERADPRNSHVKQDYLYRGGDWKNWAPATSLSSFDSLADLSEFNVTAVAGQLAGAAQSLGITDATATYLIVQGADDGGLDLSIHVSAPASGYMEVNADGSVKKLHPPS